MLLENRVAVITGANRGLGEAIATAYAREGASLLLVARDSSLLAEVAEKLAQNGGPGKIDFMTGDISQLEEVAAIRDRAIASFGRADILVNNAGVYGPIGPIEEVDWAEWLAALQINLVGTVAMCRAFIPLFKQQKYGKIINLSGGGATAPLPRFSAYAATKAAMVRLTETMAEELADFGVDVNAIAPGALNTRLLDQVLEAGPERTGADFYRRSLKQRDEGGADPTIGAELAVFLAGAASDGISGRLISAIWDKWRDFPAQRDQIRRSDVFTLRRIVPADRGGVGE